MNNKIIRYTATVISIIFIATYDLNGQTAKEIREASDRLKEACDRVPSDKESNDRVFIMLNKHVTKSHVLALDMLANQLEEQKENLSDQYLKNCKMVANQTEKLVLMNAGTRQPMDKRSDEYQKLEELSREYLKVYKLFDNAVLEFERRKLRLD